MRTGLVLLQNLGVASASDGSFAIGVNLPWYTYADVGTTPWGHRGFSTQGWVVGNAPAARGLVEARRVETGSPSGQPALAIRAHIDGRDEALRAGEVTLDLDTHDPAPCNTRSKAVDLTSRTIAMTLCFPSGSAGPPHAPNGIQFVLRSRQGSAHGYFYSVWRNIEAGWEGSCVALSMVLDSSMDKGSMSDFDATQVVAVGFKIGANAESAAAWSGEFHLLDYTLHTNPPKAFDFRQSILERDLRAIREFSLREGASQAVARVFIFGDGRAGVRWAPDGTPLGLDHLAFRDLDELLQAAERAQVSIIPVLIDYTWFSKSVWVDGVKLGGRAGLIADPRGQQVLLERVIKPVVDRYATHPWVFAWEIANELEWAASGIPGQSPAAEMEPVSIEALRAFVRLCANYVSGRTTHKVTVGAARRSWMRQWANTGLSLNTFHYYDAHEPEGEFPWLSSDQLGLDGPVLVGEVPTANTAHELAKFTDAARGGSYNGVLYWSCRARDEFSGLLLAQPE